MKPARFPIGCLVLCRQIVDHLRSLPKPMAATLVSDDVPIDDEVVGQYYCHQPISVLARNPCSGANQLLSSDCLILHLPKSIKFNQLFSISLHDVPPSPIKKTRATSERNVALECHTPLCSLGTFFGEPKIPVPPWQRIQRTRLVPTSRARCWRNTISPEMVFLP
jgi:hypothetical protein